MRKVAWLMLALFGLLLMALGILRITHGGSGVGPMASVAVGALIGGVGVLAARGSIFGVGGA